MKQCPCTAPQPCEVAIGADLLTPELVGKRCELELFHDGPCRVGPIYWSGNEDMVCVGKTEELVTT